MNILRLSYCNMISQPLSTILSLSLLTLGVGMIALLLTVNSHIQEQMQNNVRGIDMVVGAKGSPLQLILSAVYHIDDPTGNVPFHELEELQRNRLVKSAIPLSYGDSFKGYRIVGTDQQYPKLYDANVSEGRFWQEAFEVTVGYKVAQNLNLNVGDTFEGSHGLTEEGETHDEHEYLVVGVLDYTNSVLDQLIITATESIWKMHQHEESSQSNKGMTMANDQSINSEHEHGEHHEETHEEELDITAILVKFRNPMGLVQLPRMINENTSMQAAVPIYEISRLFSLMGVGIDTLRTIALVIMAVSGFSLFINLYNVLRDRQYEMALMRTYGASRWQLVRLVLYEGLLITITGFTLGIISSRIGLILLSELMEAKYHYSFSMLAFGKHESLLLVIALAIGILASLIPSIRVYNLNISKTLADA